MNRDETGALLAIIAAADKRRMFDDLDVATWHHLIGDLDFPDCRDAVIAHYRESVQAIMPAEIRGRVKKTRARRRDAVVEPAPPFDPDMEQEKCREWSRVWNRELAGGRSAQAAADAASWETEGRFVAVGASND